MSIDVQLNPTAEVLRVSSKLAEIVDEYAQDFEIRYCALLPEPGLVSALRTLTPTSESEARALSVMLTSLEAGEGVELFVSA